MITGEKTENGHGLEYARLHPYALSNLKVISANDTKGLTYRGRFSNSDEAQSISYKASQKAHNALKWLINNQGVTLSFGKDRDERQKEWCFIYWVPQGKNIQNAQLPLLQHLNQTINTRVNYWEQLNTVIKGYRDSYKNVRKILENETAVFLSLEKTGKGRVAVSYYQELALNIYLNRLKEWDKYCCWWYKGRFGITSPGLPEIVNCAYGREVEDKDEKNKKEVVLKTDEKIFSVSCKG